MGQALDIYKETQKITYTILENSINNNTLSHAYLFSSNDLNYLYNFALQLSKDFICYKNKQKYNTVSLLVDNNEYPDLLIINPVNLVIKKEQVLNLKEKFVTSSLYENNKVYIINGCEYLNDSSANALLKFLEEPEKNIYAILLTGNLNKVKETIKSRCQLLTLNNIEDNVDENEDLVLDFLEFYENRKHETHLFLNKIWFNNFDTKEKNDQAYQTLINYYHSILLLKLNKEVNDKHIKNLQSIAEKNTLDQLINKINKLVEAKEKVLIGCNIRLVMDKLIFEMED